MKIAVITVLHIVCALMANAQPRTIHVFVALCDNVHQGIVPVPESIGNGKDTRNNLYWGAGYGVKSYFKFKTDDWTLLKTIPSNDENILERVLFKHKSDDAYLLADAYDGEQIKHCIEDFLMASNGQYPFNIELEAAVLGFGGGSDLVAYVGHDGLMEFEADVNYASPPSKQKDAIVLACYTKEYFGKEIKLAGAKPLLWTTHLMAPEAYTLKAVIDGWLLNESDLQIEERAAQAYHKYQKCGINGARNLFTTGF